MGSISRRLFLEQSMLAAAAAAGSAEPLFAAGKRKKQPPQKAKKRVSPNERIRVAVIGARGRGGDHCKAFEALEDCVLVCVCDADTAVGEKTAAKFQSKPKFVQDLRRVFDDKSIDVVSIATPNHWHALAAIWAMQAGKDVYVEKPVCHNISEGRRMVQVSRKHNRICQGGTQHRSEGHIRAAAQYLREGKLGQVKLIHTYTYRLRAPIGPPGDYPVPPTVDYNLWAGPAPVQQPLRRKSFHYDWHWFWDYGNGELGNNSIHPVDASRLITGLKGLGSRVMSYGGRVGMQNDAGETPSVQITIHDFGPVTLVQEVRELKTPDRQKDGTLMVVGSEGSLVTGRGVALVFDPSGKQVAELRGPDENHFANFIKAVKSRKREEQNAEIEEPFISTSVVHVGNISQRLGKPASPKEIQAALESLQVNENVVETFDLIRRHLAENQVDIEKTPLALGPWLAVDSEHERFIDSPAADAFLTRDYRKPFVVPAENEI
jgi:hypothetical protein